MYPLNTYTEASTGDTVSGVDAGQTGVPHLPHLVCVAGHGAGGGT